MIISAIAAMAQNGVIGRNNALPWKLPEDLKRFKQITSGNPVIMGRKTHESLGRLLPKRENIIVTRQARYQAPGAAVVGSVDEAIEHCRRQVPEPREIFVIGGAELWRACWDRLDRIYLTLIHQDFEGDVRFPKSTFEGEFVETFREEHPGPMPFTYLTLERKVR